MHQLICIYSAESPVTEAFSNITQRLITGKLSEVAFKLILFIFLSDVQAFPAFVGIFNTPLKPHLYFSIFLISTGGKNTDCSISEPPSLKKQLLVCFKR